MAKRAPTDFLDWSSPHCDSHGTFSYCNLEVKPENNTKVNNNEKQSRKSVKSFSTVTELNYFPLQINKCVVSVVRGKKNRESRVLLLGVFRFVDRDRVLGRFNIYCCEVCVRFTSSVNPISSRFLDRSVKINRHKASYYISIENNRIRSFDISDRNFNGFISYRTYNLYFIQFILHQLKSENNTIAHDPFVPNRQKWKYHIRLSHISIFYAFQKVTEMIDFNRASTLDYPRVKILRRWVMALINYSEKHTRTY